MAASLTIQILTDAAKAVTGIKEVDTQSKSLGSTMKSAGAALAGAFSTREIIGWAQTALGAGLELKGAMKNVSLVFGDAAEGVKTWGENAASAFGMTASQADAAAAKIGVALTGMGMSQSQAAEASEKLVQRSADLAKVLGVDSTEVLARVEAAMRGRTAGLKDYGVEVKKGADTTEIFNAFMDQTAQYGGRADTQMGEFHATMGNLTEQIGLALIPVLNTLMPIFQALANWATTHKATFTAIVIVVGALALAFSIAATAAGIFAVASLGAIWPVLAVVGAVAALVAIVVVIIHYWGDLVGWFHTGVSAIQGVIDKLGPLIFLFGPLGAAIGVIENFGTAWNAVKTAVDAVYSAIDKVIGLVGKAASGIAGIIDKIPGLHAAAGAGAASGASASPYGVSPYGAVVTFAPSITITGDVGDPTLAGRRIVSALEAWTAANGRRRIAALVGPS